MVKNTFFTGTSHRFNELKYKSVMKFGKNDKNVIIKSET